MRDPYVFQIGFDFGTSYSKCIIRDIKKDKAFVYTFDCNGKEEFLISSDILYENKTFIVNKENRQYPKNGLWHIKMALPVLMRGEYDSPILKCFKSAVCPSPGNHKLDNHVLDNFVKSSCLFYLSRTLWRVRQYLFKRFPDFGEHKQDDMYVNMAIPVQTLQDKKTRKLFKKILVHAWDIAISHDRIPLSDKDSWVTMQNSLMKPLFHQDIKVICQVYPEVSANIQAFLLSPNCPGQTKNIYLVSDIGAGTVDQCCFTYYNDTINYFTAQIFELGSSIIDQRCVSKFGGSTDDWRKIKETYQPNGKSLKTIQLEEVLRGLSGKLAGEVDDKTFNQLIVQHLYDGNGVTPADSIRNHVFLAFSGGGDMENPYRRGVINALYARFGSPVLANGMKDKWENRLTAINNTIPGDLDLPNKAWMKRLSVAYGLSFFYGNLQKILLPDATRIIRIPPKDTPQPKNICPYCHGTNPQCFYCDGYADG